MNTDLILAKAIIDLAATVANELDRPRVVRDLASVKNAVAQVRELYEKLSRQPSPEEVQKELEDGIRKANDQAILGDDVLPLPTDELRMAIDMNDGLNHTTALRLVAAYEKSQNDVAYWKARYADTQRNLEAMQAAYVRALRE